MLLLDKFRDLKRVREIFRVLSRHGFGDILKQAGLGFSLPFSFFSASSKAPLGLRLKNLFEELGPTYIKFGQILSTRLDLFPEEVIHELSQLQDQVLHLPFSSIQKAIQESLPLPIEKIFQHIDPVPVAAASIAQVHRGILKTGEKVILKVRRPNIEKTTTQDLAILEWLFQILSKKISFFREYNLSGILDEFSRSLHWELDFLMEARNIMRFSQNLAIYPWISLPQVFLEYSSKSLLIMEPLKGIKVTEFKGSLAERQMLAERGAQAIFHQVFVDGLFHGDPHPGNIFILEDGNIGFVDFGMIGRLDSGMKENIYSLMDGVVSRDGEKLSRAILRICQYEGEEIARLDFRRELIDILDSFYGLPVKYIRFHQVVYQLFGVARRYKLFIPTEYTMIVKSLLTIERIAFSLDPEFHLVDSLKSFLERELPFEKGKYSVERIKKTLGSALESMEVLPSQMANILERLEKGKLRIEFKQQGMEILNHQLDKASRRITAGLVVCALIIGSALIITSPHRGEYNVFGYDSLGILGFFVAATLGIFLVLTAYSSR